jgi:hypothetical protein
VVISPPPLFPPTTPVQPVPHGMPDGTLTGESCYASLQKLGVTFTRRPAPVVLGACSVSDAVQLQSISVGSSDIKFSDQPTLTCGFVVRFANWITDEAIPLVKKSGGAEIAALGTGPGFQCRGRNGDSSGKLSEHAFGNAVDIERIKLSDGNVIDIKEALTIGAKYQPTLAQLRATGCQYFTTVLGPGANAAHASHFHFDLERRGKKGNNKLCE